MRTPGIRRREKSLGKRAYRCRCSNSISRRLLSHGSEGTVLAAQGSVAKTPYFPKTTSCLAPIPRASGDSGHSPGGDDNGTKTTIPNESRESSRRVSGFENRAENERFIPPRHGKVVREPMGPRLSRRLFQKRSGHLAHVETIFDRERHRARLFACSELDRSVLN